MQRGIIRLGGDVTIGYTEGYMETADHVYEEVRERVLAARDAETGVWTGELAPSALATALAAAALAGGTAEEDTRLAGRGLAWLAAHANGDGGWGDTPRSISNLSTTLIAAAALGTHAADTGTDTGSQEAVRRGGAWIAARTGTTGFGAVAEALAKVYGKDRTFAVPILAFLAMCGKDPQAWPAVPPLPFLLALLPHCAYRFLRLQVVSYALPALIAVGLCRHVCAARVRGRRAWGRWFAPPLLHRLARLQPAHGGFLDAVPLTAFVCLALRHAGCGDHAVVQGGLSFLRRSARTDGSWPIDSNLRTWVTTLAARAVTENGGNGAPCGVPPAERERVAAWLVNTRMTARHPYTGAAPGGWAWTDLPGGVPDADDTAGALLALRRLKDAGCATDTAEAVRGGVRWLLALQNRDGGMPTFCRGWGRLPFDRSCPDISAHALAAFTAWTDAEPDAATRARVRRAAARLLAYLARAQEPDGCWSPLWFGHQQAPGGRNPVIGTARVVDALRTVYDADLVTGGGPAGAEDVLRRGERWLVSAQRTDGGWGMGAAPTVEETALATAALAAGDGTCAAAARRGGAWLEAHWQEGAARPAPIGLYFALLWYDEALYPLVWTLDALARLRWRASASGAPPLNLRGAAESDTVAP